MSQEELSEVGNIVVFMFQIREEKSFEYPALIALKLGINSDKFSSCILNAWKDRKSEYNGLVISYRGKKEDTAIFLFVYRDKALAQLRLPIKILRREEIFRSQIKRAMLRVGAAQHLVSAGAQTNF